MGVAAGTVDVPDGYKCLGIVGVSSNHNFYIAFGRQDITDNGEYTVVAKSDVSVDDLIVNFRVLFCKQ